MSNICLPRAKYFQAQAQEQDMYIFVQDLSSFSSIFVQYICPLFSRRLVLVIQVKLELKVEVELEEEGQPSGTTLTSLTHFWLF